MDALQKSLAAARSGELRDRGEIRHQPRAAPPRRGPHRARAQASQVVAFAQAEEWMSSASQEVVLRGKRLTLSNLDKVLYPKAGFTKAQVIDYYLRGRPPLLPHLRDRPLTLKRYPNGVDAPFFYERTRRRTGRPG